MRTISTSTAATCEASASTRYEDSFYADYVHTPGGRQQSYHKTDASLTYYSGHGNWSLGLWAKNIENVAVIAGNRRWEVPFAAGGGRDCKPGSTSHVRNARYVELLIDRLEGGIVNTQFMVDMFAAADTMDISKMLRYLTDDVAFRFANAPPMHGHAQGYARSYDPL